MVTYYEGPHAAQFILTEANGQRSRENVEIPVGQKFPPGTVCLRRASRRCPVPTSQSRSTASTPPPPTPNR